MHTFCCGSVPHWIPPHTSLCIVSSAGTHSAEKYNSLPETPYCTVKNNYIGRQRHNFTECLPYQLVNVISSPDEHKNTRYIHHSLQIYVTFISLYHLVRLSFDFRNSTSSLHSGMTNRKSRMLIGHAYLKNYILLKYNYINVYSITYIENKLPGIILKIRVAACYKNNIKSKRCMTLELFLFFTLKYYQMFLSMKFGK